jgi:PleD family two-component response regulator
VTISCGVADYPAHGVTRDEVVAAADAALYLAKQAGRNRVASASMKKEFSASR